MSTASQLRAAKALIEEAGALGVVPTLSGNFVAWSGALPIPLLMRATPLADAIAAVLAAQDKDAPQ